MYSTHYPGPHAFVATIRLTICSVDFRAESYVNFHTCSGHCTVVCTSTHARTHTHTHTHTHKCSTCRTGCLSKLTAWKAVHVVVLGPALPEKEEGQAPNLTSILHGCNPQPRRQSLQKASNPSQCPPCVILPWSTSTAGASTVSNTFLKHGATPNPSTNKR